MPARPERFLESRLNKRGQTGINHFMPGFLRNTRQPTTARRISELR
jgi:hypothetical protein